MKTFTKNTFQLIDGTFKLIETEKREVTNEFMQNWIDGAKFMRNLGGQEYKKDGVYYSICPMGQTKIEATFK